MDIKMSATKEQKPKAVLFHISHSLFKNKRLKRRLAGLTKKKSPKKRPRTKRKPEINGRPPQLLLRAPSETIEISTDEETEPKKPEVETSIVLSSGDEDETATKSRLFPMLANETTVLTAVGNTVYELSLTQLKENLETITNQKTMDTPACKRLSKSDSLEVSISLLSDDEESGDRNLSASKPRATAAERSRTKL